MLLLALYVNAPDALAYFIPFVFHTAFYKNEKDSSASVGMTLEKNTEWFTYENTACLLAPFSIVLFFPFTVVKFLMSLWAARRAMSKNLCVIPCGFLYDWRYEMRLIVLVWPKVTLLFRCMKTRSYSSAYHISQLFIRVSFPSFCYPMDSKDFGDTM